MTVQLDNTRRRMVLDDAALAVGCLLAVQHAPTPALGQPR